MGAEGVLMIGDKPTTSVRVFGANGGLFKRQLMGAVNGKRHGRFVKHLVDLLARTIDNRARPSARASLTVAVSAARVNAASSTQVVAGRVFVGVDAVALGMIPAVAAPVVLGLATTAFHLRHL